MSFGLKDKDWVDEPYVPQVLYGGACKHCHKFEACPCGCGWGYCRDMPEDFFDGEECADDCEYAEVDAWNWPDEDEGELRSRP